MHDAYGVLLDSCRRVVERGKRVPFWLFTAEGQQHVAENTRLRLLHRLHQWFSRSSLWIKWADSCSWEDAGSDRLAGYVYGFGVKQEWAGAGVGRALLSGHPLI